MSSLFDKISMVTPDKSAKLRQEMLAYADHATAPGSSITSVGCGVLIAEGFYSYVHSGYESCGDVSFYIGLLDNKTRVDLTGYFMDPNSPKREEVGVVAMMYPDFEMTIDTLSTFYECLTHAIASVRNLINDGRCITKETLGVEYEKEIRKRFV